MSSYQDWERTSLRLFSIDLDLENPRLEANPKTQNEVLDILLESRFKLAELAHSIASNGFTPLDNIIVFFNEIDGNYIVLEGNRRIAALKLLLNPRQARKKETEAKFEKLASGISDDIKNELVDVEVIIAPSREAADKLLLNRHTTKPIESWSPTMQAKFVCEKAKQVGFSKAPQKLGVSSEDLSKFVTRYHYSKLAKALLQDEYIENVFPITNLERVLSTSETREYFGLDTSKLEEFYITTNPEQFKKSFKIILTAVNDRKIHSRTLNKVIDTREWIYANVPKPRSQKKKTSFKTLLKLPSRSKTSHTSSRNEPSKAPQTKLFPKDLECKNNLPRLTKITDELKKLSVKTYPNAVAILFRSFLEIASLSYIDYGGYREAFERFKATRNNRNKGDLSVAFGFLGDQKNKALPKDLAQVVALFKNKKEFNSIQTMNEYSHNGQMVPTSTDLFDIWELTEGYVRHILKRD